MVNNNRLYASLGVQQTANQNEIKRAYYEKAQRYHPDRAGPERDENKFKEVQGAYDILKDPEKRSVYDRYGEEGLKILNQGGENFAHLAMMEPAIIGCFIYAVMVPIFLFILFLTLRIDDVTSWSWAVVFIPVWIVECFMLIGVLCSFRSTGEEEQRKPCFVSLMTLLPTLAVVTFSIMLTTKLDDVHSISWPVVFIPLYLFLALNWVRIMYVSQISPTTQKNNNSGMWRPRDQFQSTREYVHFIIDTVASQVRNVVFILLLVLRLSEAIECSWFVVGIPQYILHVIGAVYVIDLHRSSENGSKGQLAAYLFVRMIPLGQLLLILGKAESDSYSFAVALIPIWIGMGLSCCFVCHPQKKLLILKKFKNAPTALLHDVCWSSAVYRRRGR